MAFQLIIEDTLYLEKVEYTEPYILRGVYVAGGETITYESFSGSLDPYRDGQESLMLPAGTSSSDARILYSSTSLLTYDDTGEASIADKVYLSDPQAGKKKAQRYVVMNKEDWTTNGSFQLISTDDAITYLLVREEKVLDGV